MYAWLPSLWREPEMLEALALRDIGTVYRALVARGMTQVEIAAHTGQAQSEVSAIMSGRQVMSYDLLVRIASAFDIPRGKLGLAYDHSTQPEDAPPINEDEKRRETLAHAAKITLGWPAFGEPEVNRGVSEKTPTQRSSRSDVEQLTKLTSEFASLELRGGGGVVLPTLTAQLQASRGLLRLTSAEPTRRDLLVAVALLHHRISCAAFDVGLVDFARKHILGALELAHEARDPELQACLFYSAGRMELYLGPPDTALKLFQFGEPAVLVSNRPRLRALLAISQARAYSMMNAVDLAKRAMASAIDQFHEESSDSQPSWLRFFNPAELYGAAGIVWSNLGDNTRAIAALRKSLAERPEDARLYLAFDMAELATCHIRDGDTNEGLRVGTAAVEFACKLHSQRARTRLTPLLMASRRGGIRTRDLHAEIMELQGRP